jgi:purine-binding chemotaxis protein CheW
VKRSGKSTTSSRRRAPRKTSRIGEVAKSAGTLPDAAEGPSPSLYGVVANEAAAAAPSVPSGAAEGTYHAPMEASDTVPAEPVASDTALGAADERSDEFLGFRLDAEEYCLWIRSVREIIRPTDITPIPRGPEDIMGIISLRGSIVPVFDVRRRLSMPHREPDHKSRIVVVVIDGAPVGMVVDHVTEVISAEPDALGPPPTTMGEREAGFVTATLRHQERLIGVVHLERLVAVDAAAQRAAA